MGSSASSEVPISVWADGKIIAEAKYLLIEEDDGRVWGALEVTDDTELPAYVSISVATMAAHPTDGFEGITDERPWPRQVRLLVRLSGAGRAHLVEAV